MTMTMKPETFTGGIHEGAAAIAASSTKRVRRHVSSAAITEAARIFAAYGYTARQLRSVADGNRMVLRVAAEVEALGTAIAG